MADLADVIVDVLQTAASKPGESHARAQAVAVIEALGLERDEFKVKLGNSEGGWEFFVPDEDFAQRWLAVERGRDPETVAVGYTRVVGKWLRLDLDGAK